MDIIIVMDENLLRKLLRQKDEMDWLEFKREWRIYDSISVLNTIERDELIKDILGLANGNSKNVRKSKYLIIGADDKQFDDNEMRVIYNVDYRIPNQSDITKWVNAACNPSIVGIECDSIAMDGKKLYIVTIPPTFELHETSRELIAKGKFNKFTVFMRQDEHTVPASVRDGITLLHLKQLFRQEISNPPAILFGAITGAIIAIIFWRAGHNASRVVDIFPGIVTFGILALVGGALGAEAGWIFREGNTFRYDWRYWPRQMRIKAGIAAVVFIVVIIILGIMIL
jgi:hypothetical protein